MNFVKSSAVTANKFRKLKQLYNQTPAIAYRTISTPRLSILKGSSALSNYFSGSSALSNHLPPRTVSTLPTPFSLTAVRQICCSGDAPSNKDEIKPRVNCKIQIVPEGKAYVVERFGKYVKILTPGVYVLIPFEDRIADAHPLKEEAIQNPWQSFIADDVIDGILYAKIVDLKLASPGVENPLYNAIQFALSTSWTKFGEITSDKTFEGMEDLKTVDLSMVEKFEQWMAKYGRT